MIAPNMAVTVRVDDGGEISSYTATMPAVQAQELRLLLEVMHCFGSANQRSMSAAESFARLCSLGIDAFLKEYGAARFESVTAAVRKASSWDAP